MKYLIFACFVMFGCENKKYEKPFIIISKDICYRGRCSVYTFQDRNGLKETFHSNNIRIEVGDTLK